MGRWSCVGLRLTPCRTWRLPQLMFQTVTMAMTGRIPGSDRPRLVPAVPSPSAEQSFFMEASRWAVSRGSTLPKDGSLRLSTVDTTPSAMDAAPSTPLQSQSMSDNGQQSSDPPALRIASGMPGGFVPSGCTARRQHDGSCAVQCRDRCLLEEPSVDGDSSMESKRSSFDFRETSADFRGVTKPDAPDGRTPLIPPSASGMPEARAREISSAPRRFARRSEFPPPEHPRHAFCHSTTPPDLGCGLRRCCYARETVPNARRASDRRGR